MLKQKSSDEEEDKEVFVVRGSANDPFSDEDWTEIEQGAPSELSVMKQVRIELPEMEYLLL
jgi:hypothetical protein